MLGPRVGPFRGLAPYGEDDASLLFGRDSERKQAYILVKGAMNEANQYIVVEEIRLYRQTGDSGRWVPQKVEAQPGGFEFQDFNVKPGESYSYKFVTRAARDPNAGPRRLCERLARHRIGRHRISRHRIGRHRIGDRVPR